MASGEPSISTVTLYLGLNESPQTLGFTGANHWYFDSYDHDATRARWSEVLTGNPPGAYLSFPSLKDPEAQRHTAEIIAFVEHSAFEEWADDQWKRRGPAYDALKQQIGDGLLDLVERHHPGFGALVAYRELSTPLTVEGFTGHRGGAIYGLATTPQRIKDRLVPARTEIGGLYIAGADAFSPGVAGAMMGGVFAAGAVMGPKGFPTIMGAARGSRDTAS